MTPPDEFDVNLKGLSKEDKGMVVLEQIKTQRVKTIAISVALVLGAVLPLVNSSYKNRENERMRSVQVSQNESKAALSLSTEAISRLTELSGNLGKIESQNLILTKENEILQRDLDRLNLAYDELARKSNVSTVEREKIKEDVKNLQNKKEEKEPDQER